MGLGKDRIVSFHFALARSKKNDMQGKKRLGTNWQKLDKAIKPVVQRTVSRILEESFSANKHFI